MLFENVGVFLEIVCSEFIDILVKDIILENNLKLGELIEKVF